MWIQQRWLPESNQLTKVDKMNQHEFSKTLVSDFQTKRHAHNEGQFSLVYLQITFLEIIWKEEYSYFEAGTLGCYSQCTSLSGV